MQATMSFKCCARTRALTAAPRKMSIPTTNPRTWSWVLAKAHRLRKAFFFFLFSLLVCCMYISRYGLWSQSLCVKKNAFVFVVITYPFDVALVLPRVGVYVSVIFFLVAFSSFFFLFFFSFFFQHKAFDKFFSLYFFLCPGGRQEEGRGK